MIFQVDLAISCPFFITTTGKAVNFYSYPCFIATIQFHLCEFLKLIIKECEKTQVKPQGRDQWFIMGTLMPR